MAVVTGLFIYPVKSMYRVAVQTAKVEKRGFEGDRRWLAVDMDGRFLTQREHSVLATIKATLIGESIHLEAEGHGSANTSEPFDRLRPVVIWNDTVDAVDAGDAMAEWLSDVIGFESRLVYMPDQSIRATHPDYSVDGDIVSFADGFPFLLANQASLDDLNSRLEEPVPMERFRPNIVVSGFEAFDEDNWTRLRIGTAEFRNVKQCGRCLVTTTDQETGERQGAEPLATLSQYRLFGKGAMFGANLTPDVLGVVSVGDAVELI